MSWRRICCAAVKGRSTRSGAYPHRVEQLLTDRLDLDDKEIWGIYAMATQIEYACMCMKSSLGDSRDSEAELSSERGEVGRAPDDLPAARALMRAAAASKAGMQSSSDQHHQLTPYAMGTKRWGW